MKIIKKILGWLIIALFAPVSIGLLTIDGKLCAYGRCEDVIPFWGGFLIGIKADLLCVAILLVAVLVIELIMD